jgi:hypothetical protein
MPKSIVSRQISAAPMSNSVLKGAPSERKK